MIKHKNIPIFVAHKGCPNNCVFCDQVKISGAKDEINEENLRNLIESSIEKIGDRETEIAFFGGSFTGIDREIMKKYLSIASFYVKKYNLSGIRLSTRPDYINKEILDILKSSYVTTIELGVQSMDDTVLKLNERNMNTRIIKESSKLIKSYGFNLGVQLMTSMYGSSYELDIYSANEVVKLKPDFVRIYPTVVIKGTKLYELYTLGAYKTRSLLETVDLCAKMLEIFENNNIEVIRIGLMTNNDINENNVIGAYHPAFGELVFSKKFYNVISNMIKGETENKILTVFSNKNLVSKIAGHKKSNITDLKSKYGFKDVKFKYIENNQIKIDIN